MTEITTNERFDRLTNLDISTHYKDVEYCFMKSNFLSAFVYWVVAQSPYDTPDISEALTAFNEYISEVVPDPDMPVKFSYQQMKDILNEKSFESIPAIEKLNHSKIDTGESILFTDRYTKIKPDYDFIDLGALSHNIFYMMLREYITQSLGD